MKDIGNILRILRLLTIMSLKGGVHMAVDKKGNFKRLAVSRVNKILDGIGLLGNLSNTSYYEYTMDEVDAMFQAIQEELEEQRRRFDKKEQRKKRRFRL